MIGLRQSEALTAGAPTAFLGRSGSVRKRFGVSVARTETPKC